MCWLVTAKRVATSLTRSACFRPSKISTSLIALLSSKNRKPHDPSRFGPFSQIRRAANPHQLCRTDVAILAAGYWLVTRLASCSSRRVYLRKIDHFYAPLDCRIRHDYKSMKRRLLVHSVGIGLPIFLPVPGVNKNAAVLSPCIRGQFSASRPLTGVTFDRNPVDFGI